MGDQVDFEAEGLLEGLEGQAREGRRRLLEEHRAAGIPLAELRAAVEEGRLALLAVERELSGEPRYTSEQVAELAGLPLEQLERVSQALGLVSSEPDVVSRTERDLDSAKRFASFLAAGLDPAAVIDNARVIAVAMSQLAAANREVIGGAVASVPRDTELEVSHRFEQLTRALIPMIGPSLEYAYRLQLREQLRHASIDLEGIAAGAQGAEETTVAFADVVGFTRLGEKLAPGELGWVVGRLGELAAEIATGPVRLVKLIGDAVMLASPDTGAVLDAVLELLAEAAEEDQQFPALRAGVATGPVLARGGDLYGAPVNLASRITGVAWPGTVLVAATAREAAPEGYRFSAAGRRRFKGIESRVTLFRCRAADHEPDSR